MYSFYGWVILHCVYVPQLSYPFVCTEETRIERDTCTPMFIAALCIISRAWKQQMYFSLTVGQSGVGFPESGLYVCCNNKSGQKQGLKSQKQIQCRVKINPSWIQEEGRGHIPPTAPEQALTPLETRSPHTPVLTFTSSAEKSTARIPWFWAIMCQVP